MGKLFYGGSTVLDVPDRELAHLAAVIVAKLRRDEKFALSWTLEDDSTTLLWMNPAIPMRFVYASGRVEPLDRAWLEALMVSASGTGTLHRIPEPKLASSPR